MEKSSNMASQNSGTGSAYTSRTAQSTRYRAQRRRRMFIIIGGILATALVLGLALGVGLGVGLPKTEEKGSESASSSGGSSTPIIPSTRNNTDPKTGKWIGWQPAPQTTWQISLSSIPDPFAPADTYALYDFDLFNITSANVKTLHAQGQRVVCYFSAGTKESFRNDVDDIPRAAIGKELPDWPGEFWLNTTDPKVREVMEKRLEMARQKGCDAVDPDNVDGYDNDNGLELNRVDATAYVKWLARTAHAKNMAIGLKNAAGIARNVLQDVQFSVQEQCVETDECELYRPFANTGKAVLHIEYVDNWYAQDNDGLSIKDLCASQGESGFSTLVKLKQLDSFTRGCPEGRLLPP